MSRFRVWLVSLLALLFVVPAARALPTVASDNVGDLLLFPFFYADSGIETKIRVVNTSCPSWGVIAKVVIRSSACSEEMRDFLIVLSPCDVWTGTIKVNEKGDVVLVSTDDSVIVPGTATTASEDNPFVVSLKKPKNPDDTNNFGYIEVIALAKVNWNWRNPATQQTFRSIANANGVTDLHVFAWKLYNAFNSRVYSGLAYCGAGTGNVNNDSFTGLILPISYTGGYDVNCDGTDDVAATPRLNSLYGTAEVTIPGGYAAYTATAVRDFVLLGLTAAQLTDTNNMRFCAYNLSARVYNLWLNGGYKVAAAVDTPLNYAGCIDDLDNALMKQFVYTPYYDPDDDDSCGSFVMLFFPTMQSRYAYNNAVDKYTCMPNPFSSLIWQSIWTSVLKGTIGIGITSYDNSEHPVACELSPCALKPKELYFIDEIEDIFDPYAFSEGWMTLSMPTSRFSIGESGYLVYYGLPVVPFVGMYNDQGVTFFEAGHMDGEMSVQ